MREWSRRLLLLLLLLLIMMLFLNELANGQLVPEFETLAATGHEEVVVHALPLVLEIRRQAFVVLARHTVERRGLF